MSRMILGDSLLAGMLTGMLGAPRDLSTSMEVLEWANSYCEVLRTPFPLVNVRVVHERLPVIAGALTPTNTAPLVRVLTETLDSVIMVSEIHSAGKDALFFAALCEPSQAMSWVQRMSLGNGSRMVMGAKQNRIVIAASVSAFLRS